MTTRYFYGEATDLGTVQGATARNFRELVDHYLQLPVPINRTRAEFMAMSKDQKGLTKRVNYLVPCSFATSPSSRLTQLATVCNLLFLDVDDSDEARTLQANLKRIAPFAFALYTTASHTSASPRLRLVVDADELGPLDYPAAIQTLANRLGVTANKESRVPVQPMFLPSVFADQDLDEDHPLIAEDRNGEPFRTRDIDHTAAQGHKPAPVSNEPDLDDLEFLRPVMDEITPEIISEALDSLDPDSDYHTWFEVGAALKHQFALDPKVGFDLWDQWSTRGAKYPGTEELQKRWAPIKQSPRGRVPVTIRTLLHYAITSGGWQSATAREAVFQAARKFINEATSLGQLTVEGIQKVAATTPLLSSTEEDALLHMIVAKAKTLDYKVNTPSLRRDLLKLRNRMKRPANEGDQKKVPAWARGISFVSSPGVFVRHATNERWVPENFDRVYARRLLPTQDDLEAMDVPATPQRLCTPVVKPADYVLNDIKCPLAYDFDYDPTHPNEVFFVRDSRTFLNTYTRSYPAPREENAGEVADLFLNHLNNLIREESYRKVVLDWMAYHVQHPGRKIRWAILLQGTEGCGKSFLAEVMRAVLGQQHVKTVDCAALRQTWNEWSVGHQLVVLEEIRVSGVNRHEVMNVLKPLITNPYISVNRRNTDNREWPNRTNYLLFTNHHDAIVITPGDRRYFVLESAFQTKDQVRAIKQVNPDYFVDLFNLVRDKGGELRHFFESWPISEDFNPDGDAPETVYREKLVESSANDLQFAVRDLLKRGDSPLLKPDLLSRETLMTALRMEDGLKPPTPQYLKSVLIDEGFAELCRLKVDGESHTIWMHTSCKITDPKEEFRKRCKEPLTEDIS